MALGRKFFYLTLVRHGQTDSNKSQILQGHMDTLLSETGREQVSRLSSYLSSLGVSFDLVFSSDLTRALETAEIIVNGHQANSIEPRQQSSGNTDDMRSVKKSASTDTQELTDSGNCSGTESDTGMSSSSPSPSNFASLVSLSNASSACSSPCARIKVDSRLRERSYGILEGKTLKELREAAKAAGYNEKNYTSLTPPGGESLEQVRQRIADFCCNELIDQVISIKNQTVSIDVMSKNDASSSEGCSDATSSTVGEKNNHQHDPRSIDNETLDRPVSVLITTHGGVIREFKRYFRDQYKCLLSPLHEPLQVTPNTGVNIFKVYYEHSRKKQCNSISQVNLLVYHDIIHLEEKNDQVHHSSLSKSNDVSRLIDLYLERQARVMESSKVAAEPAKFQYEAL